MDSRLILKDLDYCNPGERLSKYWGVLMLVGTGGILPCIPCRW